MAGMDLRRLPKVVLHDHLDGGVRPATVLDLAREIGYRDLPASDEAALAAWFHQAGATSLETYLEAFAHTYGVMQTPEAMARVAYEAIEDLAADGAVYAELRFAPSLHRKRGMTRADAIAGVLTGLERAEADLGVPGRVIVDALRQDGDSTEVAEVAVQFAGRGVVGFDLAGPEQGYPAGDHAEGCRIARDGGLRLTIHAGEGDGPASIAAALGVGAERIGHGVRIIEDTTVTDGEITALGPIAAEVKERHIALEVCPKSNLDTKAFPSPETHPIGRLHRAGFTVTISSDNRLMSATTPSAEFTLVMEHQGFSMADLEAVTVNAAKAAFCDEETRGRVLESVAAGYA